MSTLRKLFRRKAAPAKYAPRFDYATIVTNVLDQIALLEQNNADLGTLPEERQLPPWHVVLIGDYAAVVDEPYYARPHYTLSVRERIRFIDGVEGVWTWAEWTEQKPFRPTTGSVLTVYPE